MMRPVNEHRPRARTEGDALNTSPPIIPAEADDATQTHAVRPHMFAVLVVAERADGVLVSQVFMSLDAAERKVQRTRDRGLSASLTLVRIAAVPLVTAEDLALVGGEV